MENLELKPSGLALDSNPFGKPKVQGLNLLKRTIKILANVSIGNVTSIPSDIIDTVFDSFKDNPSYVAWRLVSRSLVSAILQLLAASGHCYQKDEVVIAQLDEDLNTQLEKPENALGPNFFDNPKSLPLLNDIKPILKNFLGCFDFMENEIKNILIRFDSYFVLSLRAEWGNNEDAYAALKDRINTPFDSAVKREVEWNNYFIELEKEILKPVFSESFSLEQIYIPLRACYKNRKTKKGKDEFDGRIDKKGDKDEKEIVVDIETNLTEWIEKGIKDDHTRIIHGDPGSGKSSVLKLFAAKLAKQRKKVIFIPLHLYDIGENLDKAVNTFLSYGKYFSSDIFSDEDKIILLFDGLDELSMQGRMLTDIAQSFLREVERSVSKFNQKNCRIQVIITGRDVVVQQNEREFRTEGQLLRLLPYLIEEGKERFIDNNNLVKKDQRNDWWKKYGQISGKNYTELPEALRTDEIDEITAQPLLNFLVALSYERGRIDFSKNTNLNEIYSDLLEAVYERKYSGGQKQAIVGNMELKDFCLIFEEIALSAWHCKGRTTTVAEINSRFLNSGLADLLKCFIDDAEQGVISLLAAFYFRQAGNNMDGSDTFEFTHKSFGEYLTARKIKRNLKTIHEQLVIKEKEPYLPGGWTIPECLVEWIKVFGLKTLDFDLIKFIRNELQLVRENDNDLLILWQETVVKLLEYVLNNGTPLEKLHPRLNTFKEENEQAINSEKALLVMHSLIAYITNRVSEVHWPERTSFGEFIGRLTGQRIDSDVFILKFCNHLDIDSLILHSKDLSNSNFYSSNLRKCELHTVNLEGANLDYAHLEGANLKRANLGIANLNGAHLEEANLKEAHLEEANLKGANLKGANLDYANLEYAHLEIAHLEGANLEYAHLEIAHLEGAHLEGANLEYAHLGRAHLEGAHLEGANLEYAHLGRAHLKGAHLKGANLNYAHLEGAHLEGAHLEGVKLNYAQLEGANLEGANLEGANLGRANLVGAELEGANLIGANLIGANLIGAIGVNLEGAILEVQNREK
ncbi:hypothetical protein FACS1894137_09160 [Spirochaetia bacterium]|nr:hypothetical protein FACS1894137_09160 [Spirochaetia bacterium]